MYHWVTDKKFLGMMHSVCSDVVNRLVQNINREDVMEVKQHLVGSGAKNLILQNENESIDLDYNLEIISCRNSKDWEDCKFLKKYIMEHFNEVLSDMEWEDCSDSTSVLTTEKRHFIKGNNTEWKIDIAITCKCQDGHWERLIHKKTGFDCYDSWVWEMAPNSKGLEKKVKRLKDNNFWKEVRDRYKDKKDFYLCRPYDYNNHPSFNVYIEVVNELYDKYF